MNHPHVKIEDYRDAEGKVDWRAYRAAEVANGEICWQCASFITYSKGVRSLCYECKDLLTPDECDHEKYVRCPKCGAHWDPMEAEDYELFNQHDAYDQWCDECDYKFTVCVDVTYNIRSPERCEGK